MIEMAPAYKKLSNPILRKTVTKVATLRQVAQIGDVSLSEMINKLRKRVGQEDSFKETEWQSKSQTAPTWFDVSKIAKSLDARSMIESGQQPMNLVLEELKGLNPGEIYELITPFMPAPLIDIIRKKGFQVWSQQENSDMIKTYCLCAKP